jgi:hypothetical protein
MPGQVWYVAYGSNMCAARLGRYLSCARDSTAPQDWLPVTLPGTVYFAGESLVWGGGRAYYDPTAPGTAPARAYLLGSEQFDDVREQEPPVYDRLLEVGTHDGVRMLTFTSQFAKSEVANTEPAIEYLDTIARHDQRLPGRLTVRLIASIA